MSILVRFQGIRTVEEFKQENELRYPQEQVIFFIFVVVDAGYFNMFSQVILHRGEMFQDNQYLRDLQELLNRMANFPLNNQDCRMILTELWHGLLFGSSAESCLLLPVGLSEKKHFIDYLGTMLDSLEELCAKLCTTEVSCKRSANEFRISHNNLKYPVGIMMLEAVVDDGINTPQFYVVLSLDRPGMVLMRMRSIYWPSGSPNSIIRVQQLKNYFSIGDSSLQSTSTTPRNENNVVYEDDEMKIADGQSQVGAIFSLI